MVTQGTLFDLPTDPEEFSVLLPPSDLRKIDFSALEFATARRAIVEYIKTYFPDDFNDFVSNNGVMMLVELLSYLTAVLSLRSDMLTNESFLPTSTTEEAVNNHLTLIGQAVRRATPAIIDIECSIASPVGADIHIAAGTQFSVIGEDNNAVIYELFKSPTDLNNDIVIPSGKRGVVAYGAEGSTTNTQVISDGLSSQKVVINLNEDAIESPIQVEVINGGITEEWNRVDYIERAGANDKSYEVRFFDSRIEFVFGDNITGVIPSTGVTISMTYRVGGGARGRIGAGIINEQRSVTPEFPFTAPVIATFRNITPSSGGQDKETLQQAKKRAPRDFASHDAIITETDYAQLVATYSHPVFGSVSKSVATIRTGLNANRVELYILAEGVNGPMAPTAGLKRAVESYVDELNVLTDNAVVLNGKLKSTDLDITVTVSRSADASIIRNNVDNAIEDFFAVGNWDLESL